MRASHRFSNTMRVFTEHGVDPRMVMKDGIDSEGYLARTSGPGIEQFSTKIPWPSEDFREKVLDAMRRDVEEMNRPRRAEDAAATVARAELLSDMVSEAMVFKEGETYVMHHGKKIYLVEVRLLDISED